MSSSFIARFSTVGLGADALVFGFRGNNLLLTAEERLPWFPAAVMPEEPLHRLVIGEAGDVVFGMRVWPRQTELPRGLLQIDLRQTMAGWPQTWLDALCRGRQLATWLIENRFCGVCGQLMVTAATMPARRCPACGFEAFPRLSPVGIVLVSRGDEILLARSPHFPPGMYSALAGYVEAGESLEACIHREVREEVGIGIRNLRWFGSQSWPRTNAMMLGFLAEYAGGSLTLQEAEIEDAQWFKRHNLPALPHPSTIACRLIRSVLDDA